MDIVSVLGHERNRPLLFDRESVLEVVRIEEVVVKGFVETTAFRVRDRF